MKNNAGTTLIELIIAFAIFVMMIAGLVAFSSSNLENWRASESRKDTYERAQIILRQMEDDLRNAFIDEEVVLSGGNRLLPAQFFCDKDDDGRQRLVFVRTTTAAPAPTKGSPLAALGGFSAVPVDAYAPLVEVAYLLDPETRTLWRAEQPFERNEGRSFFTPRNLDLKATRFKERAQVIDAGVTHLEWRFWTQFTSAWDGKLRLTDKVSGKSDSGPSLTWDSTRVRLQDFFARNQKPPGMHEPPNWMLPEFVQVRAVLEPQARELAGVALTAPLKPADDAMQVDDTRIVPDPPTFVRIGREWVEVLEKTPTSLKVGRRALSGQKIPTYEAGTVVHFGDLFTGDVAIPAFREYHR